MVIWSKLCGFWKDYKKYHAEQAGISIDRYFSYIKAFGEFCVRCLFLLVYYPMVIECMDMSEPVSYDFFLHFFQLCHEFFRRFRKHLVFFPYNAHPIFPSWAERAETEIAVSRSINDFIKSNRVAQTLIYHQGSIKKQVISRDDLQF